MLRTRQSVSGSEPKFMFFVVRDRHSLLTEKSLDSVDVLWKMKPKCHKHDSFYPVVSELNPNWIKIEQYVFTLC